MLRIRPYQDQHFQTFIEFFCHLNFTLTIKRHF
jgi:hypothetical protein